MEKTITELYWLPWTWKTTYIKNNYKNNLTNFNFIFLDKQKSIRYFNYLIVLFRYVKLNYYLIKFIIQNKSNNKKKDFISIFSWLKILSIYNIFLNKKEEKKLYMDQWLIQILFSILTNSKNINFNQKNIFKILTIINKNFNINFIFCKVNEDENKKRLKWRKTNFSQFDKIKNNEKKLTYFIKKWEKIFKLLNKNINKLNIKKDELNL